MTDKPMEEEMPIEVDFSKATVPQSPGHIRPTPTQEMASNLPQPEAFVRKSAEPIFASPLTKVQRARLARLAQQIDSDIDVSDIPPLTEEQLAEMAPNRQRQSD